LPVEAGDQPPIEYHHSASIGARANQSPEALLQAQHCLGHCVLAEWVVELLRPRRIDRVGWDGERQASDHDAAQGFADHVDVGFTLEDHLETAPK